MKQKINFSLLMTITAFIVAAIVLFAFLSVFFGATRNINSMFGSSVNSFETAWKNEYGLSFDVSSFSARKTQFDCETPLNLYKEVPEFDGEAAMFFRTNNLVVNVYIDDKPVYFMNEDGHYNDLVSFSSYCYTVFSENDIGKVIRLEIFKTPVSVGFCMDNFVFGEPENILHITHTNDMSIIVTAAIVMVSGILLVIMGILTHKVYKHHNGLFFLGMFLLLIGAWFLADTLWLFNEIGNIVVIETGSNICLSAAVPCLLMYIYDFFKINHKKLYCIIIAVGFALFVVLFLFNLMNVVSYGYTIYVIHIYILTAGVVVAVEMISYLSKINGNKGESRIFNIGVIFFALFSLFDIGRFYQGNEGDSSQMTRFGVFILIVTSAAVISSDFVELLGLAVEAGKIGKIAYTDANTGLGNPAAFKEKFTQLDRTKSNYNYIGIIQFDVNNLKIINDSLGHEAGDLLIKTAAEIIDQSFGTIGDCYRVGGDEFVAITTYNHAPLACEEAIVKFESAISRFNKDPAKPFDLYIAYGIAYYQNNNLQYQSLKEVHKLADERMYNNKRELKARYAKTAQEAIIR